uniref:Uncharacterized protein n=1 Tax=uncultured Chloroflexota bacterium TaxID=166587 RepID=H5SAJ8_9CHLR|nr:hypothetical protein HGMM_F05B10C06 [uncultured Chloroflexota bacterium]
MKTETVGKRYPLLIYVRMMDRWWPATLLLGLVLLVLAWGLARGPLHGEPWRWMGLSLAGILALLITLLLLVFRHLAYIQPCAENIRIVTPFFRFRISYQFLRRVTSGEMYALFPAARLSSWDREILEPLLHKTALVMEFHRWPLAPFILRLFLSPFFFRDKTPHLIILVDNWMRLNTELESFRAMHFARWNRRQ